MRVDPKVLNSLIDQPISTAWRLPGPRPGSPEVDEDGTGSFSWMDFTEVAAAGIASFEGTFGFKGIQEIAHPSFWRVRKF